MPQMIDVYNTGETPEYLKSVYNPEGSDLRKFQRRMLDMLEYIHKVCTETGIDYRLHAGNVLGAIRHGGFIPWDDDVDIVVDIKDFEKLKKILLNKSHPSYVLQCRETDPEFYNFWMVLRDTKSEYIQNSDIHLRRKFRGAQIDIFPFEVGCIPRFRSVSSWLSWQVDSKIAGKSKALASVVHGFQEMVLHPIFRVIGKFWGNKNLYSHSYGIGFKYYIPKDVLLPHKLIYFDGLYFNGPAKPEEFCRLRYGNYMDLPPKDKRNHHKASYKIWD